VAGALTAIAAAALAAYVSYGHAYIARAHARQTRWVLRAIIPTWASLPLPDYLAAADRLAALYAVIAFGAIALLIPGEYAQPAIGRVYDRLLRLCDRVLTRPRLAAAGLAAVAFVLTAVVADQVLLRFPNSGDEYCYVFQARAWLDGRAWYPAHPLQPFFDVGHVRVLDGRAFSVFPPGWPAVLYAAALAGVPAWIVNPILAAVCVGLLFGVGRRWYDGRVALVATAAMTASAFFLLNGASFFAHTFTLATLLIFAAAALRGAERDGFGWGLVAGAAFGAAFAARFFTALMCGLPFGAHYLRHGWRHWRFAAGFLSASLPIAGLFFWHNATLMGQWGVLPMNGFEYYDVRWFPANLLSKGTELMLANLWAWIVWTPPAALALAALSMRVRGAPRYHRLCGLTTLCLVAGYYFYVDDAGNRYGPRYYFEALPFVLLPAAWLAVREPSWAAKTTAGRWYFYLFAISVVAALPLLGRHVWHVGTIVHQRTDLYRAVDAAHLSNAVVIVSTPTGTRWPMAPTDLTRNWGRYDGPVIFALDRGAENGRLSDAFRDRQVYRYVYDPYADRGTLTRLR
jgi:hypothetical protein